MKWLTAGLLVIAAVLAGLLLYRSVAPSPLRGGTALDTPVRVPALPLLDDRGQATTLAASDGRVRLLFFGYVHCPDVCPATLASLKNTYAGLSDEQKKHLQVQFVTVDPANDTPKLVREYLSKFDPAFTGLTGQSATIDAAAKALYVANVAPIPADSGAHAQHSAQAAAPATSPDAADENVSAAQAGRIHGDEVRVITPAGEFVRVYNNREAIDGTLQRDLPGLLRDYGG
ncbi:SCO family protein [Deinococcus sp.]|uniref:SCO family protein n=1 Tax=Deinococcus sp. TaxID=47478 RepID=UPI0025BB9A53|nr:SCO family protein [Deinococcus sp.]